VTAISLEGVGKRYQVAVDNPMLVKQLLNALRRRRATDLWALRDLNLSVQPGETVGVVGRNGSGKTTLLRLLAGVSAPTVGRVRVEGGVAPLIGVGVGFNPELTGRENVFANGQILGLSPAQLEAGFDEIVAFAELDGFIDTPVKVYSSGMFLRLAFAVAAQVEPDVLLVDEVLAVGDVAFHMKCLERMRRLQQRGTTIVIVTHNLGLLEQFCSRGVVLSHGRLVFDGGVNDAVEAYHAAMQAERHERESATARLSNDGANANWYAGGATVTAELLDEAGRPAIEVTSGAPLTVRISATFEAEVSDPIIGLAVGTGAVGGVYMVHTNPGEYRGDHGPSRPLEATMSLATPLVPGSYSVRCNVFDRDGAGMLGAAAPVPFEVGGTNRASGIVDLSAALEGGDVPVVGVSTGD
jgi:ABC-type polysaccharide/polyol phosphate transport system ATPase subunit